MPSRKTNESDELNNGDGFSQKMRNKSKFVGMEFTLVQLSEGDVQKRKQKNMGTHFPGALWELICGRDDTGDDTVNVAFTSNFTRTIVISR